MSRFSLVMAASLVALVALAACSASPITQPASPSAAPVVVVIPSPSPTITPPPSVTPPPATPAPTKAPVIATPRPPTPRPTQPGLTAAEQNLLDGVQRGTKNCQSAGDSDELPGNALAGIECDSTDPAVARVGFYIFANDDDMIDAYLTRMRAEGIELDSGSCNDGEAEGAYLPDEGFALDRAGCFVNDEGFANYRYTSTGKHVYIGILGRSADMLALETFAWKGSLDTPGIPTLWNGGID
jgi:hypothetical protein